MQMQDVDGIKARWAKTAWIKWPFGPWQGDPAHRRHIQPHDAREGVQEAEADGSADIGPAELEAWLRQESDYEAEAVVHEVLGPEASRRARAGKQFHELWLIGTHPSCTYKGLVGKHPQPCIHTLGSAPPWHELLFKWWFDLQLPFFSFKKCGNPISISVSFKPTNLQHYLTIRKI